MPFHYIVRPIWQGVLTAFGETPFVDEIGNEPDAFALQIAGAMARQHADDTRAFLRALADLLQTVLPDETTVVRAGLLGGDKRPVRQLAVVFWDEGSSGTTVSRYTLDDPGKGPIRAARVQIVRDVALKTESITIADWIAAVGGAIARRAEESKSARDALSNLLFFTQ